MLHEIQEFLRQFWGISNISWKLQKCFKEFQGFRRIFNEWQKSQGIPENSKTQELPKEPGKLKKVQVIHRNSKIVHKIPKDFNSSLSSSNIQYEYYLSIDVSLIFRKH